MSARLFPWLETVRPADWQAEAAEPEKKARKPRRTRNERRPTPARQPKAEKDKPIRNARFV